MKSPGRLCASTHFLYNESESFKIANVFHPSKQILLGGNNTPSNWYFCNFMECYFRHNENFSGHMHGNKIEHMEARIKKAHRS